MSEIFKYRAKAVRWKRFLLCAVFSLAILCAGSRALGQAQNSGQVTGNVQDAVKHVLDNAKVTLTSEERDYALETKSNTQGEYLFNDVPQGHYRLTIVAPGFAMFVVEHVPVDADSHMRVDATLQVGSVNEEVVVTSATQAVDTQGATIGAIIDSALIENLPVDGNNLVALTALLPGVTDVSAPTTFTNDSAGPSFVVNGSRSNSNLFLFDGLLWNNLYQNTGLNYPLNPAIQQVSVQLNNFTAQYGRNSGSIMNVITKSGTNKFHGEGLLYYQDGSLSAADYFQHQRPNLTQYQFGGAVGGPIIRDKLFFLAEYEQLNSQGTALYTANTPTYAELGLEPDGVTPLPCSPNGAFASYSQCANFTDPNGIIAPNQTVVNPLTATSQHPSIVASQLNSTWAAQGHLGTNPCVTLLENLPSSAYTTVGGDRLSVPEMPSICFDPTIQSLLHHFALPKPNTTIGGLLYAISSAPQPKHHYSGNLRLDWNASPKHIVDIHFYKASNNDQSTNGASINNTTSVADYGQDYNIAQITAGSAGDTWILSSNLLNVFRVGYKRYVYEVAPIDSTTLQDIGSAYSAPGTPSMPGIQLNGLFILGGNASNYTFNVNENIELVDTLTYSHGHHNITAGVDLFRNQYASTNAQPGSFSFSSVMAGDVVTEFMMGLVSQSTFANDKKLQAIQHAVYSFVQDSWRVLPRLTIVAGVRYELPFEWYQPKGFSETFIRGYQSQKYPNAPPNLAFSGDPGVPRSLINTDYTNVSPRIGIAYDVFGTGKTAIRGGFGTFYDATPAQIVGIGEPFYYTSSNMFPNGGFTNPLYTLGPIPQDYDPSQPAQFTAPQTIIFPDANFRNAYTFGFNLGVQQQINKGSTLEVNYIGRLSRHLTMPYNLNTSIRDCSGIYYQTNPSLYCAGGPVTVGNGADGATESAAQAGIIGSTETPGGDGGYPGYLARLKYPGFNYGSQGIVDYSSRGTGSYHALQLVYTMRAFKNITTTASYTFSKTLDEQSNSSTSNAMPQPDNIRSQYGLSDYYSKQILNIGFRVKIPDTSSGDRYVRAVINGWSFNGVYNARTGHPFNLTMAMDELTTASGQQRTVQKNGQSLTLPSNRHRAAKINEWFNVPAIVTPNPGTAGNISRNAVIGPAYINTNMSFTKEIPLANLRKGLRAQLLIQAFNVFNTVNLSQPNGQLNPTAGATPLGIIASDNGQMRRLQFGGRLVF